METPTAPKAASPASVISILICSSNSYLGTTFSTVNVTSFIGISPVETNKVVSVK